MKIIKRIITVLKKALLSFAAAAFAFSCAEAQNKPVCKSNLLSAHINNLYGNYSFNAKPEDKEALAYNQIIDTRHEAIKALKNHFETTLEKNYNYTLPHFELLHAHFDKVLNTYFKPTSALGALTLVEFLSQGNTPSNDQNNLIARQSWVQYGVTLDSTTRQQLHTHIGQLDDLIIKFFHRDAVGLNTLGWLQAIENYEAQHGEIKISKEEYQKSTQLLKAAGIALISMGLYMGLSWLLPMQAGFMGYDTLNWLNPIGWARWGLGVGLRSANSAVNYIAPSIKNWLPGTRTWEWGKWALNGARNFTTMLGGGILMSTLSQGLQAIPTIAYNKLTQQQQKELLATLKQQKALVIPLKMQMAQTISKIMQAAHLEQTATPRFNQPVAEYAQSLTASLIQLGNFDAGLSLADAVKAGKARLTTINNDTTSKQQSLTNLWNATNGSSVTMPSLEVNQPNYAWCMKFNGSNQAGWTGFLNNIALSQSLGIVITPHGNSGPLAVPHISLAKLGFITLSSYLSTGRNEYLYMAYEQK